MNEPHYGIGKAHGVEFQPMRPNTKMTPDIPADRDPQKMGRTGSSFTSVPKIAHEMSAAERAELQKEKTMMQKEAPMETDEQHSHNNEESMKNTTTSDQLEAMVKRIMRGHKGKQENVLPSVLDETYELSAKLFEQGLSWGDIRILFVKNGFPDMALKSFRDAMFRARMRFEKRQREIESNQQVSRDKAEKIIETALAEEQAMDQKPAPINDKNEIMTMLEQENASNETRIEQISAIQGILDDAVRKVIDVASVPTPPVIVRETIRIPANDPRAKDLMEFVNSGFAPDRVSSAIRMLLADIMEKPVVAEETD